MILDPLEMLRGPVDSKVSTQEINNLVAGKSYTKATAYTVRYGILSGLYYGIIIFIIISSILLPIKWIN